MPAALQFNHAMIYSRDVAAALGFYRDILGLEVLEEYSVQIPPGPLLVYARLKSPGSDTTVALHMLDRGATMQPGAIRLYFEISNLKAFCRKLEKKGVTFKKPPELMPWGWMHAYLDDPDGHEVSLYYAGAKRLKKASVKK